MVYRYTVILDRDLEEGGYTVTVPALPGCVTEGDTVEESLAMAREAIAGYLESLAMLGKNLVPDIQEVQLAVENTDEILIYKVDVDLEPDVVQTPTS